MKDLLLFDVDNTLTISRGSITPEMSQCLQNCSKRYDIGCVSGSDLVKMREQLGSTINFLNWKFTENGLVTYFEAQPYSSTSFIDHIGEQKYQKLVNTILFLLSELILPIKRGTFIELRTGLLNICPIGRSCTQKEREDFLEYDKRICYSIYFCISLWCEIPNCKSNISM
jgi:phosphomannomutase